MKAKVAALCCIALTAGCAPKPAAIERCEAVLLPTLKAPSTYRLIEHTISLKKPDGTNDVFLTYDAVNSYNAPIRGLFWCNFDPRNATAKPAQDRGEVQADNLEAAADASAAPHTAAAPSARPRPGEISAVQDDQEVSSDEVPVCDRPDSPSKRALMNEIGVDCMGE